jgi:hypothetical protein
VSPYPAPLSLLHSVVHSAFAVAYFGLFHAL